MEQLSREVGVVGAHGFIGSHFLTFLTERSVPFSSYSGDYEKTSIQSFFLNRAVKTLIFLGGTFDPPFENLLEKNVRSLERFLEIGTQHDLRNIVYASSGAVYGTKGNEESFEDDPLLPGSLYGLSKVYAEELIKYYQRVHNIKAVILRFPHVYGLGKAVGVIHDFYTQVKETGGISIHGTGRQSRDFLHVSDASSALFATLSLKTSDTFNVSSSDHMNILEVANIFKSEFRCAITHSEKDEGNIQTLHLNTQKAKKILGFEAKESLQRYIHMLARG